MYWYHGVCVEVLVPWCLCRGVGTPARMLIGVSAGMLVSVCNDIVVCAEVLVSVQVYYIVCLCLDIGVCP